MIPVLKDAILFSKCLSFRKLLNLYLLRQSYFFSVLTKKNKHIGFPAAISVEPTDQCNLRCPECPSGLGVLTRKAGFIGWETYTSIIDQFKKYGISLNLYFQGEPFLHANLLQMITYAAKSNIYTSISTNGQLLNSFPPEELINSGLNRLIISADGLSQESYEKYRIGGRLDRVVEGMQKLSGKKRELRAMNPFIVLQFIVWRHNEHELIHVKKWAGENGAESIELKTAQVSYNKDINSVLPLNVKFNRYSTNASGEIVLKSSIPNECWKMWHSCVMTWDGNIVPCCFDKDANYKMGNIRNEAFNFIWNNAKYNQFREGIIANRKKNLMCLNCSEGLNIRSHQSVSAGNSFLHAIKLSNKN
jgi:radical SAM protein with 4Fe4S-binding SPASM domain